MSAPARWAALGVAVAAISWVLEVAHVPTPVLFAGFVAGILFALLAPPPPLEMPRVPVLGAQAVIGVTVGAYMDRSTLGVVGSNWAAVLLVCLVTLAISVLAGICLARISSLDLATSSFGMIAGGAAGIISISRELGADERVVAVLQYLRVLMIVAVTPLVATLVFGVTASSTPGSGGVSGAGLAFLAVCVGLGIPLARLVRLPAGALIGPMLIAAAFGLSGSSFAANVPSALLDLAFAVIGLDVGLRFTPASIRQVGRILWIALLMVLGMIVVSALLGVLLASLAHVSELDGYLATTPGGLSAVVALALGSHSDATFILAVQLIRTFVMLLGAPLLARWIAERGSIRPADAG